MQDIKINNTIIQAQNKKLLKAHTGNDPGSCTGFTNGGTIPQKTFRKIYEYNRFRKTKPRSTRGPLF